MILHTVSVTARVRVKARGRGRVRIRVGLEGVSYHHIWVYNVVISPYMGISYGHIIWSGLGWVFEAGQDEDAHGHMTIYGHCI